MKINKNFKVMPVLNKTLKELYFNEVYDLTQVSMLLNEMSISQVNQFISNASADDPDSSIIASLDPSGHYFIAFEPSSTIIHFYQVDSSDILGQEKVNPLQSARFLFSIDNDNVIHIRSNVDKVFSGVFNKKRNKTQNTALNLERSITNAFAKFIKTKMIQDIFSQSGEAKTLKSLLDSISRSPEIHEPEFHKFLDLDLDAFFDKKFDNVKKITIGRNQLMNSSQYQDRDKPIKIDLPNGISYDPKAADQRHGGLGNLTGDVVELLKDLCNATKNRLTGEEKSITSSSNNSPIARKTEQIHTIMHTYTTTSPNAVLDFFTETDTINIRKRPSDIGDVINILNANDDFTRFLRQLPNKGGTQGNAKGRGEAAVHMLLDTTNVCSKIEPDAIIKTASGNSLKCSVKSMYSSSAQTGTTMAPALNAAYAKFKSELFDTTLANVNITAKTIICCIVNLLSNSNNATDKINDYESSIPSLPSISPETRNYLTSNINKFNVNSNATSAKIISAYEEFKNQVPREHGAEYVLIHAEKGKSDLSFTSLGLSTSSVHENISVKSIKSDNRVNFGCSSNKFKKVSSTSINTYSIKNNGFSSELECALSYLCYLLDNQQSTQTSATLDDGTTTPSSTTQNAQASLTSSSPPVSQLATSYQPEGKVLKEVYSHLFKKKLINEGGLAGHMMHPYEALDMTPRQIIDRIKEYSTSQRIIEKVDGQNLFFTVEQDGTLMFARNKEDMSHDDLVTKFTGHPAELPFVEGGNAIKRGVKQWLNSAGDAGEMEIREIFHPDGETKSFINFEIMHPDKPNQIIYDEKYVVFHSIVDFVNGRETTYSTNKGQRLEKLIRLMTPGVTSSGFTLASNRTVNLNQLTNVQIEDYVDRIKEVTQQLDISENEFLGDGIEKQIKFEIEREGIRISDEAARLIYDFALYGESKSGNKIKSRDFTSLMSKEDAAKLRSIGLTSAAKALKKVQRIISPFKEIFVDLGIDLLQGVKSAYMSEETNQMNIDMLKDKLQTAVNDLTNYMNETSEEYWEAEVHRLRPHLDKVTDTDISSIVSTAVEGGVYDNQGDLLKVTGGFAPLNQILGAAYRDRKGIFPTFKQKFMQQESNRRSLKAVFNLIY